MKEKEYQKSKQHNTHEKPNWDLLNLSWEEKIGTGFKNGDLARSVVHACYPSTGEAEAGGLWVQEQSGLHGETLVS